MIMRVFREGYTGVPEPSEEITAIDNAISSSLFSLEDLLKNREKGLSPGEAREAVEGIIQLLERKVIVVDQIEPDRAQENRQRIEDLLNFKRRLVVIRLMTPELLNELKGICGIV